MIHITTLDLRETIGDEEFYVSQCLEYDIKGIGVTRELAKENFNKKLHARIESDKARGIYPLSEVKPAPKAFWNKYNEAAKLGMKVDKLELSDNESTPED